VAKVGNRFAALQPAYDAVINRFGGLGPDIARGIKLRHDWAAIVGPTISRVRSTGSASRTTPPSSASPWQRGGRTLHAHPQGAVPVVQAIRRRRRTAPKGWPPSSSPITRSGSSNAWAIARPREAFGMQPRQSPRNSHGTCPTNRALNRRRKHSAHNDTQAALIICPSKRVKPRTHPERWGLLVEPKRGDCKLARNRRQALGAGAPVQPRVQCRRTSTGQAMLSRRCHDILHQERLVTTALL
jgi:hypothetical protein